MNVNTAPSISRTFSMLKPDSYARGLWGTLLSRIESKGLKIVGVKFGVMTREMAVRHYRDCASQDFFEALIDFVTSGPVLGLVLEGPNAVEALNQIVGEAIPLESAPGTIRADYALKVPQTVIHRARDAAEAACQIRLWFAEENQFANEDILPPAEGNVFQMADNNKYPTIIPVNPDWPGKNTGDEGALRTGFDYQPADQPEHLRQPFNQISKTPRLPSEQIHCIDPGRIQEY